MSIKTGPSAANDPVIQDALLLFSLSPTFTSKKLRRTYHKLALKYHPDRAPPDQRVAFDAKFVDYVKAYEILHLYYANRMIIGLPIMDNKRKRKSKQKRKYNFTTVEMDALITKHRNFYHDQLLKHHIPTMNVSTKNKNADTQHNASPSTTLSNTNTNVSPQPTASPPKIDPTAPFTVSQLMLVPFPKNSANTQTSKTIQTKCTTIQTYIAPKNAQTTSSSKRTQSSSSLLSNQPSFAIQAQKRRKIQQIPTKATSPTPMDYDTASDISFIDSDSLFDSMSEASTSPTNQPNTLHVQSQSSINQHDVMTDHQVQILPQDQVAHVSHSFHFPLMPMVQHTTMPIAVIPQQSQIFSNQQSLLSSLSIPSNPMLSGSSQSADNLIQMSITQNTITQSSMSQIDLMENPFLSLNKCSSLSLLTSQTQMPIAINTTIDDHMDDIKHGPHSILPPALRHELNNKLFTQLINLPSIKNNPFLLSQPSKIIHNLPPSPFTFETALADDSKNNIIMIPNNNVNTIQNLNTQLQVENTKIQTQSQMNTNIYDPMNNAPSGKISQNTSELTDGILSTEDISYTLALKSAFAKSLLEMQMGVQHQARIDVVLSFEAFMRHIVLGDGNCFFYCISQHMYGDCHHHLRLRSRASQYLLDNPQQFFPFFSGPYTAYAAHCNLLGKPGIWADALIIRATALTCNNVIKILLLNNYVLTNTVTYPTILSASVIHLVNINNRHFDLLLPFTQPPLTIALESTTFGPTPPNSNNGDDEDDDILNPPKPQHKLRIDARRHQKSNSNHKWRTTQISTNKEISHNSNTKTSQQIKHTKQSHTLPSTNSIISKTHTKSVVINDDTDTIVGNLQIATRNGYRCPYKECVRSHTNPINSRHQLRKHVQTHIDRNNLTQLPTSVQDLHYALCKCGKIRSTINSRHICSHFSYHDTSDTIYVQQPPRMDKKAQSSNIIQWDDLSIFDIDTSSYRCPINLCIQSRAHLIKTKAIFTSHFQEHIYKLNLKTIPGKMRAMGFVICHCKQLLYRTEITLHVCPALLKPSPLSQTLTNALTHNPQPYISNTPISIDPQCINTISKKSQISKPKLYHRILTDIFVPTDAVSGSLYISDSKSYRCPFNECPRSMSNFFTNRFALKRHAQAHINKNKLTIIPPSLSSMNFTLCVCGTIYQSDHRRHKCKWTIAHRQIVPFTKNETTTIDQFVHASLPLYNNSTHLYRCPVLCCSFSTVHSFPTHAQFKEHVQLHVAAQVIHTLPSEMIMLGFSSCDCNYILHTSDVSIHSCPLRSKSIPSIPPPAKNTNQQIFIDAQHIINKQIPIVQNTLQQTFIDTQHINNKQLPIVKNTHQQSLIDTQQTINKQIPIMQNTHQQTFLDTQHIINKQLPIVKNTHQQSLIDTQQIINKQIPTVNDTHQQTFIDTQHIISKQIPIVQSIHQQSSINTQHISNKQIPTEAIKPCHSNQISHIDNDQTNNNTNANDNLRQTIPNPDDYKYAGNASASPPLIYQSLSPAALIMPSTKLCVTMRELYELELPVLRFIPNRVQGLWRTILVKCLFQFYYHWDLDSYMQLCMLPKLILWKPTHKGKRKYRLFSIIKKRMILWLENNTLRLWMDAHKHSLSIQHTRARYSNTSNESRTNAKALYHVRHANLTTAITSLVSHGIAQPNINRMNEIRALHPRASPPVLPLLAPTNSDIAVSEQKVLKRFRKYNPAVGIGPDSYAPHHYLSILNSPSHQKCLTILTAIINRFIQGKVPARAPFFAVSLLLLFKDASHQKTRPIAIGCLLRRVTASLVVDACRKTFTTIAGTHHLGLGTTRGCDIAAHSVRLSMLAHINANMNNFTVCKLDISNAYNTLNRTYALSAISSTIPNAYQYFKSTYMAPTPIFYNSKLSLESQTGLQQGDPLGSLGFDCAMYNITHNMDSIFETDLLSLWIHDDGLLAGPADKCSAYLNELLSLLPPTSLNLNFFKSHVHHSPIIDQPLLASFPPTITIHDNYNFEYLGTVFGTNTHKQAFFQSLHLKLDNIISRVACLSDPQSAHVLCNQCLGYCRIAYTMAVQAPVDVEPWIKPFDELMFAAYQTILGISLSPHERLLIRLPTSHSGIGLRCCIDFHLPTFIASRLFCSKHIHLLLNTAFGDEFMSDALHSDDIFIQQFQDSIHDKNIVQHLFHSKENHIPTQKQLSKPISSQLWHRLLSSTSSSEGMTHLISSDGYGAGAFLHAIPKTQKTRISSSFFRTAAKVRLNHRFYDVPLQCSSYNCSAVNDIFAFHSINCKYSDDATSIHFALCNLVFNWCKRANLHPKYEQTNLFDYDERRPGDIYLPYYKHGRPACIDVGITSPIQIKYIQRKSSDAPLYAANMYEQSKMGKYSDDLYALGIDFIPFIVESLGGIGTIAQAFINYIARIISGRVQKSFTSQRDILVKELSCLLWSGTSRRILARDQSHY